MRRVMFALAVMMVIAVTSAAYVWQRLQPAGVPPLEPSWQATVAVLAGDARFSEPFGIAAAADGTIFVTDAGQANSVRRISPDGRVSTLATGFSTPSGLALASDGTLYVVDTGNHTIRRISPEGVVSTLAGDGTPGYADGPAALARFNGPIGIAVAPDGRVVVADTYNDRLRVIEANGVVKTLAGSGRPDAIDGVGDGASFDTPTGLAIDARGLVYVADTGNGVVRTVDPVSASATARGWRRCSAARPASRCFAPGSSSSPMQAMRSFAWWQLPHNVPCVRPRRRLFTLSSMPTPSAGCHCCGQWRRLPARTRSRAASARCAGHMESDSIAASTSESSRARTSARCATASCRIRSRTTASVRSTSGCASANSPMSTSAPGESGSARHRA